MTRAETVARSYGAILGDVTGPEDWLELHAVDRTARVAELGAAFSQAEAQLEAHIAEWESLQVEG